MKRIAYLRVSSVDQSLERQQAAIEGRAIDRVFTDKASGKDADRPALQEMLAFMREGDHIVVHSMDRLARNVADLLAIVDQITRERVTVEFVKEGLTFAGDDAPMSRLLLTVMGAVAEFERAIIKERQREGIAQAKKVREKYRGGKPMLSFAEAWLMRQQCMEPGANKAAIAREHGISRACLYQYLNRIPKILTPEMRAEIEAHLKQSARK